MTHDFFVLLVLIGTIRLLQADPDIFFNNRKSLRVIIDKNYMLGAPAECFKPECTGTGKKVKNLGILDPVPENIKKSFSCPVGGWPDEVGVGRGGDKLFSFGPSAYNSQL